MRYLVLFLIGVICGSALVVTNPSNYVGQLLAKTGQLESMWERYTFVSAVPDLMAIDEIPPPPPAPPAEPPLLTPPPTPPTPPTPPPAPEDPHVARLNGLIANLEKENQSIKDRIDAIKVTQSGSNTKSGDAKRYQRDLAANKERIAEYNRQLQVAIERAGK